MHGFALALAAATALAVADGGPGRVTTAWGADFVGTARGVARDEGARELLPPATAAPRGSVLGLATDRGSRLWVATDGGFGPIDARGVFARTLVRAGAPGLGRIRSLSGDDDGTWVVRGDAGEFRHRPDEGAPPTVEIVHVEGRAPRAGEIARVGADGVLDVDLRGTGRGGVVFAWREWDVPGWHPFQGVAASIEGLAPGRRELVFAAFDCDLRRSPLARLAFEVDRPAWTMPSRLVVLAVCGVLLLVGVFARRGVSGRGREIALATLLSSVIACQLVAALSTRARGWPFVGFAMFREVAAAEAIVERTRLFGVAADGTERIVEIVDSAAPRRALVRDLIDAIDEDDVAARRVLAALNARAADAPWVGFRMRTERERLTEDGPAPLAPIELVLWREARGFR
jgi:hypothetical protein